MKSSANVSISAITRVDSVPDTDNAGTDLAPFAHSLLKSLVERISTSVNPSSSTKSLALETKRTASQLVCPVRRRWLHSLTLKVLSEAMTKFLQVLLPPWSHSAVFPILDVLLARQELLHTLSMLLSPAPLLQLNRLIVVPFQALRLSL